VIRQPDPAIIGVKCRIGTEDNPRKPTKAPKATYRSTQGRHQNLVISAIAGVVETTPPRPRIADAAFAAEPKKSPVDENQPLKFRRCGATSGFAPELRAKMRVNVACIPIPLRASFRCPHLCSTGFSRFSSLNSPQLSRQIAAAGLGFAHRQSPPKCSKVANCPHRSL